MTPIADGRDPHAIALALLAVMAAADGDTATAQEYISRAQRDARTIARRGRQVIEIAALVVAGHRERATGLALEHVAAFPDDAGLVARVASGFRGPR